MINAIRGSVQDQQKIREGERNINLDVLRSIAIFCVIMTHEAQAAFPFINNIDKFFSAPLKIKLLGLALHTLGRCGVPVFFFLTGYLVMTKRFNNTDDIVQFWKTHLMPLTITCAIWGIIYYFYGIILEGNSFSVTRILRELLYYQNYEGIQFWYIPHIIGIYIFLPFVTVILDHIDEKILFRLWILAFIYQFFPGTVNPLLTAIHRTELNSLLDLSYIGNKYGILVLTGYWLAKKRMSIQRKWTPIIMISCYIFLVWERMFCYSKGITLDLWYDNIILVLMCIALFEYINGIRRIHFRHFFTWISKNSFGIYLVHNLFTQYFGDRINFMYMSKFLILIAP